MKCQAENNTNRYRGSSNDVCTDQLAHPTINLQVSPLTEISLRGYDESTWLTDNKVSVSNGINNIKGTYPHSTRKIKTITISSIISHYFCPRCAYTSFKQNRFIQTIQGVEGQINHFLIERILVNEPQLVHKYTDQQEYYRRGLDLIQSLKKQAKERFGFTVYSLGGNFDVIWCESERIAKSILTKSFTSSWSKKKTDPIPVQRECEIPVASDLIGIRGRLDLVENAYIPIEIKTGRAPKVECYPSDGLQVTLYALLIENKFAADVNEGYVFYSRIGEKRLITIDNKLREKAVRERDAALLTFLSDKEPQISCNKCRTADRFNNIPAITKRNINYNILNNNYDHNDKSRQEMNQIRASLMTRAAGIRHLYGSNQP
jgi:CRISPR/Cas system-associated exonuclease Cas4 (RecB family)